jgi:hypothetical protein
MEFEKIKVKQMNKSNLVNEVTKVVSNKSGPVNAYGRVWIRLYEAGKRAGYSALQE